MNPAELDMYKRAIRQTGCYCRFAKCLPEVKMNMSVSAGIPVAAGRSPKQWQDEVATDK